MARFRVNQAMPLDVETLRTEIAQANFLRAIEQVESETQEQEQHQRAVKVLSDLGKILPVYLSAEAKDGYAVGSWNRLSKHLQNRTIVAEELDALIGAIRSWQAKWNLWEAEGRGPWIREAAYGTLKYWFGLLRRITNEGHGDWVATRFGLNIQRDDEPSLYELLAEELSLEGDPRGNKQKQLLGMFNEDRRQAEAVVGKRWKGLRVMSWDYGRGRNARTLPEPSLIWSPSEQPAINELMESSISPGMIRARKGGARDLNLRLLVRYQVEGLGNDRADFAAKIDRHAGRVGDALNATASLVGLKLR